MAALRRAPTATACPTAPVIAPSTCGVRRQLPRDVPVMPALPRRLRKLGEHPQLGQVDPAVAAVEQLHPRFIQRQALVGPNDDALLGVGLEIGQRAALAVLEVKRSLRVHRQLDTGDALIVGRYGQTAHNIEAHAFGRLDQARAFAMGAIGIDRALEARAHALAGHLDDAELAHAQDLGLGPIVLELVVELLLEVAAVALVAQVDEVADDHAAQVAQAELAGDLLGGLHVGLESG